MSFEPATDSHCRFIEWDGVAYLTQCLENLAVGCHSETPDTKEHDSKMFAMDKSSVCIQAA